MARLKKLMCLFLLKSLNQMGIKVKRVTVLPDSVKAISDELCKVSKQFTVVLTSGGIGPTHDDVTYEAVADACNDTITTHPKLLELFGLYLGEEFVSNPAVVKQSSIPSTGKLNFYHKTEDKLSKFPIISVQNIYMLPGVPMLLKKGFKVFHANFVQKNVPHISRNLFLSVDEISLTSALNETVETFKNKVKLGSYPSFSENYFKVKITFESCNNDLISDAYSFFCSKLPPNSEVHLKDDVLVTAKEDLVNCCKQHSSFQTARDVVERAFDTYDTQEMCICFNGGKDCTALLHLIYSCMPNSNKDFWKKILVLYIRTGETFHEVENFIHSSAKQYDLNLTTIEGDLKSAITIFLEKNPKIRMVFMGTRSSDPDSTDLTHFCDTDYGWPPVMRVLPILEWSYENVWTFIRSLQLPYCILYDRGYTSIGLKPMTVKNPALLVSKDTHFQSYKPAYMLTDGRLERNGRLK